MIEDQNPFADALILSLYRWIKSPRSKLHDPALQRLLQGLMKKVRAPVEPGSPKPSVSSVPGPTPRRPLPKAPALARRAAPFPRPRPRAPTSRFSLGGWIPGRRRFCSCWPSSGGSERRSCTPTSTRSGCDHGHGRWGVLSLRDVRVWALMWAWSRFLAIAQIVINTVKTDHHLAESYFTYIVRAIKSKPLFAWLEFHPRAYWQYLLWMDSVNHGGVLCEAEAAASQNRSSNVVGAGREVGMHTHCPLVQPSIASGPARSCPRDAPCPA